MAKITMDASEYEAMKKVEKLLEQSLEKERTLQTKLEKITKEKMEALEQSAMRVVKIHKVETRAIALRLRDTDEIWKHVAHLMGIKTRVPAAMDEMMSNYGYGVVDLERMFFKQTETISEKPSETTIHGLDEVTAEIREEYAKKQSKEVKSKLQGAKAHQEENVTLLKASKQLSIDLDKKDRAMKAFVKELDALKEKTEKLEKNVETSISSVDMLESIETVLKDGYGMWNKAEILDAILKILHNPIKDDGKREHLESKD